MSGKDGSDTLQTTTTSIEILKFLEKVDGARVSEIAEGMNRPKSTVYGHLATLEKNEFVIQRGDFYLLGPELLRLGNHVRTREDGFVLRANSPSNYSRRLDSDPSSPLRWVVKPSLSTPHQGTR
ncbi:helix-turn-helix domain-containing protein [Haladaptatus pallidirubidus]|uniref:helix-turn-helix domain-containing protein n=1 Tax=Haladaptatus pallidirubidus TaxID=1008152 RepID=UPI0035E4B5F4